MATGPKLRWNSPRATRLTRRWSTSPAAPSSWEPTTGRGAGQRAGRPRGGGAGLLSGQNARHQRRLPQVRRGRRLREGGALGCRRVGVDQGGTNLDAQVLVPEGASRLVDAALRLRRALVYGRAGRARLVEIGRASCRERV